MGRAIDLLPPELKPFFEAHRDELVVRVLDPDLWRTVGWAEDPNHFLDFGVKEYGPFPFTALPTRLRRGPRESSGREVLERNGRLPWRLAEIFGHLRRSFEGFARRLVVCGLQLVLFSAIAVPLHPGRASAAARHRQLRRPADRPARHPLALRARSLRALPVAPEASSRPRAVADVERPRHRVRRASGELSARRRHPARPTRRRAGKEMYDDAYYEKFFAGVQPVMEQRLSEAISATAGMIIGAWEQAGKPAVRSRTRVRSRRSAGDAVAQGRTDPVEPAPPVIPARRLR